MKKLWVLLGRGLYVFTRLIIGRLLRDTERTRVLVTCDDKVLLIKDWVGNGQWVLPGGGVHKNELATDAAVRELREETSLQIDRSQLRSAGTYNYDHNGFRFRYQLFIVSLSTQPAVAATWPEVAQVAWIPRANLGSHRLSPEVLTAVEHWSE